MFDALGRQKLYTNFCCHDALLVGSPKIEGNRRLQGGEIAIFRRDSAFIVYFFRIFSRYGTDSPFQMYRTDDRKVSRSLDVEKIWQIRDELLIGVLTCLGDFDE